MYKDLQIVELYDMGCNLENCTLLNCFLYSTETDFSVQETKDDKKMAFKLPSKLNLSSVFPFHQFV